MRSVLASPLGFLIGLSLGALGGGGSILAVPALVYAAGQDPRPATTTSLVLVAFTAVIGMVPHWRAGRVRLAAGTAFGLAGVGGSLLGSLGNRAADPDVLLLAFSGLMLVAAAAMLRRCQGADRLAAPPTPHRPGGGPLASLAPRGPVGASLAPRPPVGASLAPRSPVGASLAPRRPVGAPTAAPGPGGLSALLRLVVGPPGRVSGRPAPLNTVGAAAAGLPPLTRFDSGLVARVLAAGTVVGLLTGFFGVGGGFVIVPALVLALGFTMSEAVGTSLLVITINSVVALSTRLQAGAIEWGTVLPFTVASLLGVVVGSRLAATRDSRQLQRWFVALLVVVALYTATRSGLALT